VERDVMLAIVTHRELTLSSAMNSMVSAIANLVTGDENAMNVNQTFGAIQEFSVIVSSFINFFTINLL
jgi:hypothetical protein